MNSDSKNAIPSSAGVLGVFCALEEVGELFADELVEDIPPLGMESVPGANAFFALFAADFALFFAIVSCYEGGEMSRECGVNERTKV